MSEVPKFVRQHLAQQAAGAHPDANLLAALAEGALSRRDRAQVLEHLSACAACRETVALALPEIETAATAGAPAATPWARWPRLRWAGVVAAVVVVAAAVVVKNARRPPSTELLVDRTGSAAPPTQPKPLAPIEKGQAAKVQDQSVETKSDAHSAAKESLPAKAPRLPDKKTDAGAARRASRNATIVAQAKDAPRSQAGTARAPVSAAPAAQPEIPSQAFVAAPGEAGMAITDQVRRPQVIAPAAPGSSESAEVFGQAEVASAQQRTKAEVRKSMARNSVGGGAVAGPAMAKVVYTTPRWRISDDGAVERSLDAGQSWQRIPVGARESFRSVSMVENDVWAGGARGALYHSSDSGRTWTAVPVKSADAALETDIARVEFTDTQHGIVTTTTGDTWSTGDGGATWSMVHR